MKNGAYVIKQEMNWDSSPKWQKVITFEYNLIKDVMESDDELKNSDEKMMLKSSCWINIRSKVLWVIPKLSLEFWSNPVVIMITLFGLIESSLTGTFIHPTVLKHINYTIEQGEESEWKTAVGVTQTNKYLKVQRAMLPSITISWWFNFPWALHNIPKTEQQYQIILGNNVIRAIEIHADMVEGIFEWHVIKTNFWFNFRKQSQVSSGLSLFTTELPLMKKLNISSNSADIFNMILLVTWMTHVFQKNKLCN